MKARLAFYPLFLLLLFRPFTFAQADPATGLPPFASFNRSAVDTIDVGNMDIHFEFPIFVKKGRGLNFAATIVHDNSVLRPYNSGNGNGPNGWDASNLASVHNWGVSVPSSESVTYTSHQSAFNDQSCWDGTSYRQYWWYSEFVYLDSHNTPHDFNEAVLVGGPSVCAQPTSSTGQSADGYVLSVTVDPNSGMLTSEVVTDPSGNIHTLIGPGGPTLSDPNGNTVSHTTSNQQGVPWTWTDSTGNVALEMLATTSSQTYSYPNPAGGISEQVTLTYSPFTVNTNFQCPTVVDWTGTSYPTQQNFVTAISLPDGTSYSIVYESTSGTYPSNIITGRIHSLILPSGASITYIYSGGNNGINCQDGSPAIVTKTTPDGTWVYNHYYTPSTEWTGQWTTIVTDPAQNDTVYTFGSYSDTVITTSTLETQHVIYQGSHTSGTPLATIVTCYNGNFTNCATLLSPVPNPQSDVTQKDVYTYVAGVSQPSLSQAFYEAGYHFLTRDDEFGYGVNTGAAPTTTPLKSTIINYATVGASHDRLSCVQVSSGASPATCGTVTAATQSITNYLSFDAHGNPGTVQNWVSGSKYLSKSISYFSNGLINTETDFAQNPTTYTYGACNGSYPTQITIGGLSESFSWDCNGGVVTSASDANSQPTQLSYINPSNGVGDPFWRVVRVTLPRGGTSTTTYNDNANPANQTTASVIDSSHTVNTQTIFDGLGRQAHSNLTSDPDGIDYQDFTYDGQGRSHCTTNLYRTTSDSTYDNVCSSYDAPGRPTTRTRQADGTSVSTQYGLTATSICGVNGLASITTDEAGKKKQNWTDALGRLVEVDEPDAAGAFSIATCYQYDALSNIRSIVQRGGSSDSNQWRVRSYTYDGLSRVTSASTPESGTMTYVYDSNASCTSQSSFAGELISITDGRGVRTCVQHDVAHRITGKTYSDGTAAISYLYDQTTYNGLTNITNGLGRRTGMSDGTGQTAWSYDADGNVVTKQQTISGVTNAIGYTYNLDDSVNTITTPNNHVYTYRYGNAGRALSLADNGIGATYVQGAHYNAPGQLTSAQHGLGITETNEFNNQLQPSSILVTPSGLNPILSLSFTWPSPSIGNNGTLYRIVNNLDGSFNRSTQYTYDQLNRLLTAGTVSGASTPWTTTYGYDAWGNLLQKSTSGPGEPNVTLVADIHNRVNGQGGGNTYDAAGNLTFDGGNGFSFDAENHFTPNTGSVVYSYDGDGRRVKTVTGDGTTQFWYDNKGTVISTTGAWVRDYVYFNNKRLAYFAPSSGNQHYYWSDHLKSARIMSNSSGSSVEWEADYFPYGTKQVYNNSLDNFFLFTEDQYDYEIGYNYSQAREQSPVLGRFISPDPFAGSMDLRNPQSLNRYSYVLNNPLNAIDPNGLDCVYFNNQGRSVESIDHNSDSKECGDNGGDWVNGTTYKNLAAYNRASDTWEIASYDSSAEQIYWSEALAPGAESDGTTCSGNCDTANGYSEISYQFFNAQLQPGIGWYGALNWAVNQTTGVPRYQQWTISDPNGRHWCGAGGTGVPTGNDDWSCMAHDTNYLFTGNTFPGDNYNPFADPSRGRQLQQINQTLCNNVTSARIRGFFTAAYWGCR